MQPQLSEKVLGSLDDVEFQQDGIVFRSYPYRPASVYRKGRVTRDQISEIDPASLPPEIRLKSGEILFVGARLSGALRSFADTNGIPIVSRIDVWSLILEPFLDTEFDEEHQERTFQQLNQCGLSRSEVESIRRDVERTMLKYNAVHWDWAHLGLMDLLDAHNGFFSRLFRLPSKRFHDLYWRSIKIANKGGMLDLS